MKAKEIWELVKENRQIVRYMFDLDSQVPQLFRVMSCMELLKQRIPALLGADPEVNVLSFQSEDEGVVCVIVTFDEESGQDTLIFSDGTAPE